MRNSVSCRSYHCCSHRIRRKSSKIFIFTTMQMKWKKKVFSKPLIFFFFWEGRCDGGCRYWIRGKEQKYHSSWLKRTKTLTRFIEVDFIITMMSGSYTLMSHLFSCKITACKATSHWRHNKLSARNVFKLVWQFLLSMHLDSAFFNTPRQWKCFVTCLAYQFGDTA